MGLSLPEKINWNLSIIKAIDNKESVESVLNNAEIYIPEALNHISDDETFFKSIVPLRAHLPDRDAGKVFRM